jgi:tetratricopeptide (TPR) repeat protein
VTATLPQIATPGDSAGEGRAIAWRSHALRLNAAVESQALRPGHLELVAALGALTLGAFDEVDLLVLAVIDLDPTCAVAWRLIGMSREARGRTIEALEAYRQAYMLDPGAHDVLVDLGRLARSMGMHEAAADLIARALAIDPGSAHLACQLAEALGDGHQYDRAIAVLECALAIDPENALLLDGLGAILLQQGETEAAAACLDRALAAAPDAADPRFHRAKARFELGDHEGALSDCDAILRKLRPEQTPAVLYLRSQIRLSLGDLAGGWADYEARLSPLHDKSPHFDLPGRRLGRVEPVVGRRVLVIGEQGLGDEMMFAGAIPDLIRAVGPDGAVQIAVSPRLVSLFARSFPEAVVSPYQLDTLDGRAVLSAPAVPSAMPAAFWMPIGDLAARFRATMAAFERPLPFLRPDPGRIAHWRAAMQTADGRPTVGLTWKSMQTHAHRRRQYPRLEDWAPLLGLSGVRFVNLQYGDCEADIAHMQALGAEVWRADGVDLTDDIDEAAAISAAVDLAIGVGNASINLAAGVGAPSFIICPPAAWPRLGQDHYPWFNDARVFSASRFGDWTAPITAATEAAAAFLERPA